MSDHIYADEPEPEYILLTLAWCNSIRKGRRRGPLDRLPRGRMGDPGSCPCGQAAGVWVRSTTWCNLRFNHEPDPPEYPLPDFVQRFVANFDSGLLPQYVQPVQPKEASF